MRPTVEIWLEVVKEQLAAGDSAVIACSKANIVSHQYQARFRLKEGIGMGMSPESAIANLQQQYEKVELPIPSPGYVSGDPEARS